MTGEGETRVAVRVGLGVRAGTYLAPERVGGLVPGARVVVEGFRGLALGEVVGPGGADGGRVRRVVRIARPQDLQAQEEAEARVPEAIRAGLVELRLRGLDWRLITVTTDGVAGTFTFMFLTEERGDPRELADALGRRLGARVEVRQLGPRDEARVLGGLGRCGRELCCATFLPEYPKVNIRLAKDQGLGLAQDRASGVCGRTLCCLSYEVDFYKSRKGFLPKIGKPATTSDGLSGRVIGVDVVRLRFQIIDEQGRRHDLPADAWDRNDGKELPDGPSEVVQLPGRRTGGARPSAVEAARGAEERLRADGVGPPQTPRADGDGEPSAAATARPRKRRRRKPRAEG